MLLRVLAKNAASAERAREKMLKTGYTIFGQKLWTGDEDLICRVFYPDYFAVRQILYNRSELAIKTRCRKLGLIRPRKTWKAIDKQKLRKLYPEASHEELLTIFPGAEWRSIQSAANYYGYRRKKKPYKITGILALDQLRLRCYEIKWTMRDVDEASGTKRYFQTRGYRRTYPNFRMIYKGVLALGGRLEVSWTDFE